MRFGVWAPTPQAIATDPTMRQATAELLSREKIGSRDRSFAYAIETVKRAEAHGFDITLVAERFLGPDLEAWILATALAMETTTIQILTAVHPGIVPPAMAAKFGASLDRISDGRFAVNVVNGWSQAEFDLYGNGGWVHDSGARYRRMEEFIRIMSALWTEDSIAFESEFYRGQSGALPTKPYRKPRPPIYAASNSETGQAVVAKHCDYWFASYKSEYGNFDATCARMAGDVARVKRLASDAGNTLGCGVSGLVICAPTEKEARERAAALEEMAKTDPTARLDAARLGLGLVGTPEQIAGRIARYENEVGLELLMLQFLPMSEMDVFACEVMPLVNGRRRATA